MTSGGPHDSEVYTKPFHVFSSIEEFNAHTAKSTEGRKDDSGKPPMSLIPKPALDELAKVLDFGRKKYDSHNWRKGMKWSRVTDAAMRHLTAWYDGEDIDPESGLSHLGHCLCCLAFLATYQKDNLGQDDRFKPENN